MKLTVLFRIAFLLATASLTQASVITYSTFAAWDAALSSETDVNLTGITNPASFSITNQVGSGHVFFQGSASTITVGDQYLSPKYADCVVACIQDSNETNGSLIVVFVTLPNPVNAFAFVNFWPSTTSSSTISTTIGSFTDGPSVATNIPEFFGFISSAPFTRLTINSQNTPNITSIAYGSTITPEPGVETLSVLGLAALAIYRTRRRPLR